MRRFQKISQAFALLFCISIISLLYNNCGGPKTLLGNGVALYTPKANLSSTSNAASPLYQPGGAIGASSLTANPNIQGVFEGIRGDVVLGWACVVKKAAATKINIYVGGVQYAEIMTSLDSEPAISDSTHCNAAYSKNRFFYRFKEDQTALLMGKTVTVFATDPANMSQTAQLSANGSAAIIGDRPLWYAKLPLGYAGSPIANPLVPNLTGLWESTIVNADGSLIVNGWACSVGSPAAVALSLYTAQNEFIQTYETNLAMAPSETASLNTACGIAGSLRRFSTKIESAVAARFANKEMHITLAEPFIVGVSYSVLPRSAGATSIIPMPPASVATGTAPGASPGSSGGGSSGGSTGGATGGSTGGSTGGASATGWSCGTPGAYSASCDASEHCPNSTKYTPLGLVSIPLVFNFTGTSSDSQIIATIGNTSVSGGYTLSDVIGVSFACISQSATKTAIWQMVPVVSQGRVLPVQCTIVRELPATDVKCCPKDRNGQCINPNSIGVN